VPDGAPAPVADLVLVQPVINPSRVSETTPVLSGTGMTLAVDHSAEGVSIACDLTPDIGTCRDGLALGIEPKPSGSVTARCRPAVQSAARLAAPPAGPAEPGDWFAGKADRSEIRWSISAVPAHRLGHGPIELVLAERHTG
jgi:hypothetical protein